MVRLFSGSYGTKLTQPFNTGMLADLQDIACQSLNCTWECSKPEDGLGWGLSPISGPPNVTGVWGGVLGSVLYNKVSLSLSSWFWVRERFEMFDFVPYSFDQLVLAMSPKPPSVDIELFMRPFTNQSWFMILLVTFIQFACFIVPYFIMKDYTSSDRFE